MFVSPSRKALAALAAASGASALVLWAKIIAGAGPAPFVQGTICGAPEGLLAHCPLCLPAAALSGVALGALSMLIAPAARLRPARNRNQPCK